MSITRKMQDRHFSSQQQESNNQSNAKIARNKENLNLFNEVNNLLQYYQSNNVLKSNIYFIQEKTSLPSQMVSPKKIVDEILRQQSRKTNSKSRVSVSQNMTQKNLSLSPIESKKKLHRCTFHSNKKAKYFEIDNKVGTVFYCSECSVSKLLKGCVLFPIEQFQKKRDNQSVTRANFWSVEENSLLSNSSPFEAVDTFASISDELEDKARELREFQESICRLQTECQQILVKSETGYQTSFNAVNTELQQMLYLISIQSLKMVQQLQAHNNSQNIRDLFQELTSIRSDIESNEQNILNNMQMKPFKLIMQKYKEKVRGHSELINESAKGLDEMEERLTKLQKVKRLLKNQFHIDPEDQELMSTRRKLASNVYISFENKEMFLAAQRGAQVKDEVDTIQVEQQSPQQHLLESPNFIRY